MQTKAVSPIGPLGLGGAGGSGLSWAAEHFQWHWPQPVIYIVLIASVISLLVAAIMFIVRTRTWTKERLADPTSLLSRIIATTRRRLIPLMLGTMAVAGALLIVAAIFGAIAYSNTETPPQSAISAVAPVPTATPNPSSQRLDNTTQPRPVFENLNGLTDISGTDISGTIPPGFVKNDGGTFLGRNMKVNAPQQVPIVLVPPDDSAKTISNPDLHDRLLSFAKDFTESNNQTEWTNIALKARPFCTVAIARMQEKNIMVQINTAGAAVIAYVYVSD